MKHIFKVYDTDPFFMVDAATRAIKNMSQTKVSVIQGDHNSERFTFQLPRYIEEHDMMEADKVEVHFLNAGTDQTKGVYTVDDLSINDEDTTTVKCSWLLSKAATAHAGKLSFLVRFVCFAEDGVTVDYEWNTAIFSGISVGEGMDCSDVIDDEAYIDIIEQWKTELKAELKGWIDDEVASQVDLVQIQKNTQNIETLTEEHNLMKAKVDNFGKLNEGSTTADAELLDIRVDHEGNEFPSAGDAVREASRKAAQSIAEIAEINARAIICKAEGKYPTVTDSASETNFRGLKIYGRTEQIHTKGENYFNLYGAKFEKINSRAKEEILEDGTLRIISLHAIAQVAHRIVIPLAGFKTGKYTFSALVQCEVPGTNPGIYLQMRNSADGTTKAFGSKFVTDAFEPSNVTTSFELTDELIQNYDELTIATYVSQNDSTRLSAGDYADFTNIMLSTTDSEYEPYSGLEPSPSPSYPQTMNTIAKGGSVTVTVGGGESEPMAAIFSTPNGLPGIPVASGGNYTDESGQMWVADEIDLEKGVYIKRTKQVDLKTISKWNTWGVGFINDETTGFYVHDSTLGTVTDKALCTFLKYNLYAYGGQVAGVKTVTGGEQYFVVSVPNRILGDISSNDAAVESFKEWIQTRDEKLLVTIKPIETPLTEEEIAAYKALKSHKPVTTIINDADAHIEAEYVADTKTYIDNKFAELASAIVNNS